MRNTSVSVRTSALYTRERSFWLLLPRQVVSTTWIVFSQHINAVLQQHQSKENRWHRRFGHLGESQLHELARKKLVHVHGFDYNPSKSIDFVSHVFGKHHRSPFPTTRRKRADTVLGLVHSDVCGKMNTQSLGGALYFFTFVDDKSHYTWVYVLKHKSEVLQSSKSGKLPLKHHLTTGSRS